MKNTSQQELMAVKNQLKEARKDIEMSNNAYEDTLKSNESLKKKVSEQEKKLSDLENSGTRKDCNCNESLKQQKLEYEALKRNHNKKITQFNELKKSYETSRKDNAYNMKQSLSREKEKDHQIKELIKNINSLNELKFNSVNKKDHENMKQEYKDLKIKYSELQQSLQESLQGHNQNGNVFIMPSLEWVENPTKGKPGKYKYNPTPRSNSNVKPGHMEYHPKSIPEALNEYYFIKDSGNVEALNKWNDRYNSPRKYEQIPDNCPEGGQPVAQGYYTQNKDKHYDSDESDSDPWDGGYFPPRDEDDFFGDADVFEY